MSDYSQRNCIFARVYLQPLSALRSATTQTKRLLIVVPNPRLSQAILSIKKVVPSSWPNNFPNRSQFFTESNIPQYSSGESLWAHFITRPITFPTKNLSAAICKIEITTKTPINSPQNSTFPAGPPQIHILPCEPSYQTPLLVPLHPCSNAPPSLTE